MYPNFSAVLVLLCAVLLCEWLLYYPALRLCSWPRLDLGDPTGLEPLRALVLSDPHLLGERSGHWWDRLRREWQMERSFQTALSLLQPHIVFILGDVFDEGRWNSPQAWQEDLRRFHQIFRHPKDIDLIVVMGNHDVGAHHERSDAVCFHGDKKTAQHHHLVFTERHDTLSREASQKLLWWFNPRLILSGHTHKDCHVVHGNRHPEVSVPSFSWRNRNDPSFLLASLSAHQYQLSSCALPEESSVLVIYCSGALLATTLLLLALCRHTHT
ncbi:metallophosphoesterase 1-like [Aplochiton taeniatus]